METTLKKIISENNFTFAQFCKFMATEYKFIPIEEVYKYYFDVELTPEMLPDFIDFCVTNNVSLSKTQKIFYEGLINPVELSNGAKFKKNKTVNLLKIASTFCAKDQLRPIMEGVNLTEDYIYSTDAHALLRLNRPDGYFTEKIGLTIKPSSLQAIDGRYPNAEGVMPTHGLQSYFINTAELLSALNYAQKINKLLCNPAQIALTFDLCCVHFNIDKLITCINALAAYNVETIRVKYQEPHRAVLFEGDNILTLCMPVLKEDRAGKPYQFINIK